MQTELQSIGGFDLSPGGVLSLAMTALRLSVPNEQLFGKNVITLEEVAGHDSRKDCWIVIYDRVYDFTRFLDEHPGGSDILLEHAGRDATLAFRGAAHTAASNATLDHYLIGELPLHERIFRKPDGIRLSNIPH